jgi:hypothetical protein
MLPMIKDRSVQIQVGRALMICQRAVDLLTCDVVLLCQDRRRAAGGYGMDGQKHQVEACPSPPPGRSSSTCPPPSRIMFL